jgi:hypothetical protein
MAAADDGAGHVFFAGGSVNPYNFNGIGYDGWFYIVGGMRKGQEVSAGVFRFKPGKGHPCKRSLAAD